MEAAINKAGRQRMLGQRIVKSCVQMAAAISPASARGQLADAIWAFDTHLRDLKLLESYLPIGEALAEVQAQWAPFRKLAIATSDAENLPALRYIGERLLQAAERSTAAFERCAGTALGKLVNLAGRQRMLSQRIAKSYLIVSCGFGEPETEQQLRDALAEFGHALACLQSSAHNSEAINAELAAVAGEWLRLKELASRDSVLGAAEAILERMERVTALYQPS